MTEHKAPTTPLTTVVAMSSEVFRVVEHEVPCQHIREYPHATSTDQEDTLYLAVKQYIPLDNPNPQPGDITVIGAHGNAFAKVWAISISSDAI